MKFNQVVEEVKLKVGDTILIGKFKNKKAEIKDFDIDDNNQPVVVTDKGTKKMYNFRIDRLMPKKDT